MIKFRLNPLSSNEIEKIHNEGDNLQKIFDQVLDSENIPEISRKYFKIFVEGIEITPELWNSYAPASNQTILIAIMAAGGEDRGLWKQAILLAVVIAIIVVTEGAGYSSWQLAAIVGTSTIAASLLLNKLLPPIVAGLGDLGYGSGVSSLEDSQMYSIANQTNALKKFGSIPQVYGKFKMFPNVAATPYVELITDPDTGELCQYFYAIYDFGYGPLMWRDLKIGDTPFSNYVGARFNFVDLNRPVISEGPWDDQLLDDFTIYKGSIDAEQVSIAINKNKNDGALVSEYQILRSFPVADSTVEQEFSLMFSCPQGLTNYSTDGSRGNEYVEVDIKFASVTDPVGFENWRGFNDPLYVSSFVSVGGNISAGTGIVTIDTYNSSAYSFPYFYLIQTIPEWRESYDVGFVDPYTFIVGMKSGDTTFYSSDDLANNTIISYQGTVIGKILSRTNVSTFYLYTLDTPIPRDFVLKSFRAKYYIGTYYDETGLHYLPPVFQSIVETAAYPLTYASETSARLIIRGNSANPIFATAKFTPKLFGDYKIKIERIRGYGDYSFQRYNNLSLLQIATRNNNNPIVTDKRHLFLEVSIKATNQLNGSIQNLSAIVQSVLPYHNGTIWAGSTATSNPSWIYCDILTGQANKKPIANTRLDTDSIVEWAAFCDEVPTPPTGMIYLSERYSMNFIMDYNATVQELINQVTNSAQASLNLADGKYGVLIDKRKTTPVQVFTPRNSWGFSSTRDYFVEPHGLKVKYIDSQNTWELAEKIVYNDGYTEVTAENFDEIQSFGCINDEQAWRFGRYVMAQNKLRKESITINVDFEHLVCTRGDYVKISQDVMRVGGTPARVKTVVANRITIDDGVVIIPATSYGYTFRASNGDVVTSTLTVVASDTFDVAGQIPAIGNLIIIGVIGNITYDCIVKSIMPKNDLTATLLLVERADAIYDAESTSTFPAYNAQINANINSEFVAPPEVENLAVITNTWECLGGDYNYYVDLDWDIPNGAIYDVFEVYCDRGQGYVLLGFSNDSSYHYDVPSNYIGVSHSFKVLGLSVNGKKIDLGGVTATTPITITEKNTPPSSIANLYLNVTGEVLQIDWVQITDCDVREYLIRYSPLDSATWENSIPLLRVDRNTTMASTQARTGTYLIKAVDWNYNESVTAAYARTSIPDLLNLNFIETTTDFPALPGAKDKVIPFGNALILQTAGPLQYYPEGYYYYSALVDLGDIYTARIQSSIQAEGFAEADMMINWTTLSSVLLLSNSRFSEWDVFSELRGIDNYITIDTWTTLDGVSALASGLDELWTEWRKFTIGDFTARIFQFRLKLISNLASVSPKVYDGTIRIDMPDRYDTLPNIIVPNTGLDITYAPAFAGPTGGPAIQVTQDAMQQGDYYVLSNRTITGFNIKMYDKNDVLVQRQVDISATGWGRKGTASI
jgi:hypothetical protein